MSRTEVEADYPYQRLDSEIKQQQFESYPSMIWKTMKRAGKMLLSFTYSAELPLLLVYMGHLSGDPDDHTQSLAAAILAVTVFDTAVLIPGVISFATMFVGGRIHAEMKQAESTGKNVTEYKKDMERLVKTSFIIAAPLMCFSMGLLGFSKTILVNLFRQDEAIAELAQQFLRPAALIIPFTTLRFILQQPFFIHEEQAAMTSISILSFLSGGVFLSYGLGYGINSNRVSLPAKGMLGIFYGIMTENILSTTGVAACLFSSTFKDYHFTRSFCKWDQRDKNQIFELLAEAIPIEISYLSELATLLIKTAMAGYLGPGALAAQNFAGQISFLALLIAHVVSQASSLNVRAAQYKSRFMWAGIIVSLLASGVVCTLISIFPQILTVFLSGGVTDEVMLLARILVPLTAVSSILYTACFTMLQILRTKPENKKFTAALNFWLWVSVLLALLLGFPLKLGVKGIAISSLLGNAAGTVHLLTYCRKEFPAEQKEEENLNFPHSPSKSLRIQEEEEPVRVSSSWCGCFSRIINRFNNWYNPQPTTSNSRS